jgi:hypothetical protein
MVTLARLATLMLQRNRLPVGAIDVAFVAAGSTHGAPRS